MSLQYSDVLLENNDDKAALKSDNAALKRELNDVTRELNQLRAAGDHMVSQFAPRLTCTLRS